MQKRFLPILLVSLSLSIGGCSISTKKEEVVTEKHQEKKIIPKYNVSDNYFKTVIPLNEQILGGEINQATNSKLDVTAFEEGLFHIASKQFNRETHYLQRGEFISQKKIHELLKKQEVPYVSNIIEHDYFTRKDAGELSLAGIIIGLAMTADHSNEEAMTKATEMSNHVLQLIHSNKNFKNVPITFAVFKQEPTTSIKPGVFISSTTVQQNEKNISQWTSMHEQKFIYPSDEFQKAHDTDKKKLDEFKDAISEFYKKDYYPVKAVVTYNNEKLDTLTLDTVIKFNGKSELLAYTQVVSESMLEKLPKDAKIQVTIKSEQQDEAVIVKEKNKEKPFVYFFEAKK
ncbi:CamS family sex pheromone protein [Bacillus cytotoxicus]|uniref:Sex pheromone n=1 Tax=Bacillus cytotoxicus (strain DSM 22905 / CIP 110041 / 391-98 / NVH 391-98) TaxID=315749 RepID=A7GQE5_BACCN|nr:CamS family sex pheromone protein [Bacillus cytotoxicus]ABS22353.1 conserved hypothetical protein [Bacillus cytotoxicus NVH 391-98]AWC45019.1 sex pheromone [Bacillus cytotoxicus]MDH2865770.1 CamS family sex pheromone protein [Bacillus cytotoxicus]MDH2885855.1 CamS family sex pheromone protein [Bacillus cytotoxicus]NZD34063.1 CamS family sex pheromone protein [Bacillus cytotoxicus]